MSDRARALKIVSITSTYILLFTLIFLLILSILDEFTIYTYIFLSISFISCIYLWKSYLDEKKLNNK
ncbi:MULTISPECIES: hypothetical protein [unclassified Clostridium]|uniref:hypothetical protein n=1 Tax=unclassified Clostridium TaxID=2614128 RepID=UPI0025BBD530|nr:hypothetical protein [Clostridium sp.]MCI6690920.1 hypothetical protein [Clostridium sp.]MDY2630127.1 hypothetical protein [Clostridium sp.]MDY4253869.1 hypothetical protein [Clostridium sp.]MDY6227584.1 hypothetical protein [Clostridium sp.]